MSENDSLSSINKLVPTLTGLDTFLRWQRAVRLVLLDKGAISNLTATETEPFRRAVDLTIPGDTHIVRPPGSFAGESPPDATNSSTNAALTNAQRTLWDAWAAKERKARVTLLLTVSEGIAGQVEHLWSANDIWTRITATHQIRTSTRRNAINNQISLLHLPDKASYSQMIQHLEKFTTLISEGIGAGLLFTDQDQTEKFLLTFGDDFESFRINWDLRPDEQRSWESLVSAYRSIADSRHLREKLSDAVEAGVNAVIASKDAVRQTGNSGQGGQSANRGGHPKQGGSNKKVKGKKGEKKCTWCTYKGHEEKECRKKAAGEPSKAQVLEATKALKQKEIGRAHV